MTTHDVAFSQAGLGLSVPPTLEQALSGSPAEGPSGPTYSSNTALINALGLVSDHVVAIESRSYSQPRIMSQIVDRHDLRIKFASSPLKQTRSQARIIRRKSRYPNLTITSPPRSGQTPPPANQKASRGAPGHSTRKPSSSSRRTSRHLMIGHNPIGLLPSTNQRSKNQTYASQRESIFSSLSSIVQATDLYRPLTGVHRRSSRHLLALERESKSSAESILPPLEIHPLTFSPFLADFGDRSSGVESGSSTAPSTPLVKTPPCGIMTLSPTTSQKDLRDQKALRRYGRCPSTFPNVHSGSPTDLTIEQAQKDAVLAATASTPPATLSCPPRSDSLRGRSRADLEKATETTERTKARETKSVPNKVASRPKLILQIPQNRNSSQIIVIHGPVTPPRQYADDIEINSRVRPLPPIPITRQKTV
jgi:hypothetical protein